MRKAEAQGANAVQMTAAVALGGLLALGVALMVLLVGAVAVSQGVIKEDAAPQVTAAACVLGCFAGGMLACTRWGSRRLIAGLCAGAMCWLLLLTVAFLMSGGPGVGLQALIELAGCLCGGAAAGMLSGRGKKKRTAPRRK